MLGMNSQTVVFIPILSGEVFEKVPESIRVYICYLESRTQQLESQAHELEARLSKNSSNSSNPPSSDELKRKSKSLRGQFDKKPDSQQGRTSIGLAQGSNPDVTVTHTPGSCNGCGSNLSAVQSVCTEQRQVFDLPQPKVHITEYRVEKKTCPCCGEISRASFPDNIKCLR